MHPKLDWPEHSLLMRHVAAKTSKRIQKSSFLWEKNTHSSYFVFVSRLQKNASSDSDDIGITRLLMATAAMKNQTDRFYTTAIVFAGRSVYTTLFEIPLPCAKVTRNAGLAAPIGVCSYCNLCNSQKLGARSAPVLPTKQWR